MKFPNLKNNPSFDDKGKLSMLNYRRPFSWITSHNYTNYDSELFSVNT